MIDPQTSNSTRRIVIAAGLALLAGPAAAAPTPCAEPRVLFVCQAGTVKSAIAREELRRRARARGLAVQVSSRGVHPEDHVSPTLAAKLSADGIDPKADPLRALEASDIAGADVLIAFDEAAHAPGLERARNWAIPSYSQYAEAKAALAPKLDALLEELAARPCRRGP
jgi:protein-tyrosine-phosphatase